MRSINSIRWLALSLALTALACASGLPKDLPNRPTAVTPPGKSFLVFRGPATVTRIGPTRVDFVVAIVGDGILDWCPEEITWSFGPLAKPTYETRTLDCLDRNFENYADFSMGTHTVRVTLRSGGRDVGSVQKVVQIGPSSEPK